MNKYVLTFASLLALGTSAQAYTFAPNITEAPQHADFAYVAEMRVIAANPEMQKAWVNAKNAKTENFVQWETLGRTYFKGLSVVMAGFLVCSFVEWLNEYRAHVARTSSEIENIKLRLAQEKERAAANLALDIENSKAKLALAKERAAFDFAHEKERAACNLEIDKARATQSYTTCSVSVVAA